VKPIPTMPAQEESITGCIKKPSNIGRPLAWVTISLVTCGMAFIANSQQIQFKRSENNALQLLTVLNFYALDHEDVLPPDWATAFEATGVDAPELPVSPLGDDGSEYLLLTPGAKLQDLPANTPILRDPHEVRPLFGLHRRTVVGYADGSVKIERVQRPKRPGPQ